MEKRLPVRSAECISRKRKIQSRGRRDKRTQKAGNTAQNGARHLKKSHRILHKCPEVKYMFIKEHRKQYGLSLLCQVLSVSSSGYRKWLRSKLSSRARENRQILARLIYHYRRSHCTYGMPRTCLLPAGISSNQERRAKGKQEADNQIYEEKQYPGKDEQKV